MACSQVHFVEREPNRASGAQESCAQRFRESVSSLSMVYPILIVPHELDLFPSTNTAMVEHLYWIRTM
jgi:hypothetical protein